MQYIVNQNVGTTAKHGSRPDIRYITTSDEVTAPLKGHHSRHGSARGSQELLASQPRMKNKKEFNQVVGLMDANLEALMIRDNTIQSSSRRGSAIEDNDSKWQQRGRKPKR